MALFPLACAVAIEPELKDDEQQPRAGSASLAGASSAGTSSGGSASSMGGSVSRSGSGSGGSSTAGKPSTGGSGAAGNSSGGKGGAAGAGGAGTGAGGQSGAGTAGSTSAGCSSLKSWKGGDPTLQIAAGEVIQWMGKRYKATAAVAYPNADCVPDNPVEWCAGWFEPDGDC